LSIAWLQKKFENASNATPIIKSTPCRDNAPQENPNAARKRRHPQAMQLDHVTLVTPDPDAARRFFVDIAGLADGPRPPFSVDGYWLYANARPVLHLIATGAPAASSRAVPRIDHFAFRVDTAAEWQALLGRLDAAGVGYQTARVPQMGAHAAEQQVFVALAPSVVIEFVTAAPHAQL
jgi:catechol 2,3-dioxygenase-like lactoylglutathione lyase family enzyme